MTDFIQRMIRRRKSYRMLFLGDNGTLNELAKDVLADLHGFCYADKPTVKVSAITQQIDPLAMAVAEGRREVWMRINRYLTIGDREVVALMEREYENQGGLHG